jgi:hypothetical protein
MLELDPDPDEMNADPQHWVNMYFVILNPVTLEDLNISFTTVRRREVVTQKICIRKDLFYFIQSVG